MSDTRITYQYQIRLLGPVETISEKRLAERVAPTEWVTVSKEEFMQAEKVAGFHAQHPGTPATNYFCGNNIEGKTILAPKESK